MPPGDALISFPAMRNPVRLKNLNRRFLPLYLVGLAVLVLHPPKRELLVWALPLIVLGTWLRGWGAGHLVKNHELTMSGPYAYLRHPLYAGTILIATGFAVGLGGWLAVALLAIVWPWFALRYFPRKEAGESRRLEERYGERFARYRAAVPALWPRFPAWAGDAEDVGRAAPAGAERRGWDLERYSDNNELGTLLAIGAGYLVFWLRAAT